LLSFLVEYYGFSRVTIMRLQEPAGLERAEQVTLSDVLSGVSPDYAIIAQKGDGDAATTMAVSVAHTAEYGLSLDLLAARFDAGIPRLNQISAELERIQSLLSTELAQKNAAIAALEGEISRLNACLIQRDGLVIDLEHRLLECRNSTSDLERRLLRAQHETDAMRNSTSLAAYTTTSRIAPMDFLLACNPFEAPAADRTLGHL
jgi:hypothetical protein